MHIHCNVTKSITENNPEWNCSPIMTSWDGSGREDEVSLLWKSHRGLAAGWLSLGHVKQEPVPGCHPAAPSAGFSIHSARLCVALAAWISPAFTVFSYHLLSMVSWGKQSQKPYISLKKKKPWHEMWTGIWYVKILLFLHVQWYLERLEVMFRFYLFLVAWTARGFFWEWLQIDGTEHVGNVLGCRTSFTKHC